MKNVFSIFGITVILALVLAGCETEEEEKKEEEKKTTLTINNESAVAIYYVKWHGTEFGYSVYSYKIGPGESFTKNVSSGSGYIFFRGYWSSNTYQTKDVVVVGKNENVEFTFTNNTVVMDSAGNSCPISELTLE